LRDKGHETASSILDEGFGNEVLLEEALELVGQGSGDVWRQKDGVIGPGTKGVDGGWAAAADLLTIEGEELLIAHGLEVAGVGAVAQEDAQAISLKGAGLDDGGRERQVGVSACGTD